MQWRATHLLDVEVSDQEINRSVFLSCTASIKSDDVKWFNSCDLDRFVELVRRGKGVRLFDNDFRYEGKYLSVQCTVCTYCYTFSAD